LVGQNTRFVAPPPDGAFDLERKRLERHDGPASSHPHSEVLHPITPKPGLLGARRCATQKQAAICLAEVIPKALGPTYVLWLDYRGNWARGFCVELCLVQTYSQAQGVV